MPRRHADRPAGFVNCSAGVSCGRGGRETMVDSMLFGQRAKKVQDVGALVEVIMADGSAEHMSVFECQQEGIDDGQIGASLLDDMLN